MERGDKKENLISFDRAGKRNGRNIDKDDLPVLDVWDLGNIC